MLSFIKFCEPFSGERIYKTFFISLFRIFLVSMGALQEILRNC